MTLIFPPPKPQAVAFDLDGTLVDSESLVREAYVAAACALGLTMSDDQFRTLVGLHREANDAQLRTLYGNDFPLENFYTGPEPTWATAPRLSNPAHPIS